MTESVNKEEKTDIEKIEEKPKKSVITPEFCSYTNDEDTGYVFEVILPGVEKDTINLKLNEDTIFVSGETDTIRYVGSYGLCCPIDAEKARANYKNGLLRIEAPYKDVTLNTVDITIE